MTRRLFCVLAAAAALATATLPAAHGAEVRVVTSVALKSALDELAPAFEKASGHKLNISYDLAAAQKKRVLDGASADVVMLTRAMMEDLHKQGKFAGSLVNVASTPVATGSAGLARQGVSARLGEECDLTPARGSQATKAGR